MQKTVALNYREKAYGGGVFKHSPPPVGRVLKCTHGFQNNVLSVVGMTECDEREVSISPDIACPQALHIFANSEHNTFV